MPLKFHPFMLLTFLKQQTYCMFIILLRIPTFSDLRDIHFAPICMDVLAINAQINCNSKFDFVKFN